MQEASECREMTVLAWSHRQIEHSGPRCVGIWRLGVWRWRTGRPLAGR